MFEPATPADVHCAAPLCHFLSPYGNLCSEILQDRQLANRQFPSPSLSKFIALQVHRHGSVVCILLNILLTTEPSRLAGEQQAIFAVFRIIVEST